MVLRSMLVVLTWPTFTSIALTLMSEAVTDGTFVFLISVIYTVGTVSKILMCPILV